MSDTNIGRQEQGRAFIDVYGKAMANAIAHAEETLEPGTRYELRAGTSPIRGTLARANGVAWYRNSSMDQVDEWDTFLAHTADDTLDHKGYYRLAGRMVSGECEKAA